MTINEVIKTAFSEKHVNVLKLSEELGKNPSSLYNLYYDKKRSITMRVAREVLACAGYEIVVRDVETRREFTITE